MNRYKTLPLGVDIGTARARIALAEHAEGCDVRVRAIASRDVVREVSETPALLAALLEEMIAEVGTKQRRCVAAIGGPRTALRVVRFPKMSWRERLHAARFEAQRFGLPGEEPGPAVVRVHRAEAQDARHAIGVASKALLQERVTMLKLAGLRPVAVDHDAVALRRALGFADAILDVGAERSTLHIYAANWPLSHHAAIGGADVTRSIARELSIDVGSAERRKRILGAAGTGSSVRHALVSELSLLVDRARSRSPVSRIALVGNGARLPGLASDLEAATSAIVELPVPPLLETDAYPEDVIRAAAPDWTLAAALTTWVVA